MTCFSFLYSIARSTLCIPGKIYSAILPWLGFACRRRYQCILKPNLALRHPHSSLLARSLIHSFSQSVSQVQARLATPPHISYRARTLSSHVMWCYAKCFRRCRQSSLPVALHARLRRPHVLNVFLSFSFFFFFFWQSDITTLLPIKKNIYIYIETHGSELA